MSRSLLHDWECSIEKNKNNTEELLNIAEDIYNTAYERGKASTERPQGGESMTVCLYCSVCKEYECRKMVDCFELLCCKCRNLMIPITQPLDDLSNSV